MSTTVPEKSRTAPLPRNSKGGFTLVELLVAGVIVLIAVVAVVAIVRQSTELQVTDHNRRQARAVIMNEFETCFGYNSNFGVYSCDGYNINLDISDPADTDAANGIPRLIARSDGATIPATINVQGSIGSVPTTNANLGGGVVGVLNIPVIFIRIDINWTDVDDTPQNITLFKQLANQANVI